MNRYAKAAAATVASILVWRRLRTRWPSDTVHPIEVSEDDDTMSAAVRHALELMYTSGSDAEKKLERHLSEMRGRPEASVEDLRAAYRSTPEVDFSLRWSLVYLAGQLELGAFAEFLAEVLLAEIPDERSSDVHGLSTVSEECKIRAAALDGLEVLTLAGSDPARDALDAAAGHPIPSVRALAVVALMSADPASRDRLENRMDDEDRWMLELRRTAVTDVTQIRDPAGQIHPSGTRVPIRPAPGLGGDKPAVTARSPWRRPPTTGRS